MAGIDVTLLKCPQCSASIDLHSKKTKAIACSSCGALFDSKTSELLANLGKPAKFRPYSFLRLGLSGTFDGKQYQIIGRIRYHSQLREWDHEDKVYTNESWESDEWHLVGEAGDFISIYEDRDGYEICRPFVPTNPGVPEPNQDFFSLHETESYRIAEYAKSTAVFFEGEFTWKPESGEQEIGAEYVRRGINYSVCRRLDKEGKDVEVEFFESTPATRRDLAEAFQDKEELERINREVEKENEAKKMMKVFFGASFALLVLALIMGSSGKAIFQESVPFSSLNEEEGHITAPFSLTKVGRVHNLQLKAVIPDNSEAWAAVELLEDEDSAVNEFEGEFWRESGYDDEGSWSEEDTTTNNFFRLEQAGQYQVRILGNPGSGSGNVTVSVVEGVTLSRFFLFASLLSALYGAGIYWKRSLNPFLIVLGVVLLTIFLVTKFREAADDD